MQFVRVLESGVWRTAPIGPNADSEKTLVQARVVGLWNVNHKPVDVVPGLILSFLEPEDAQFFKTSDVGSMPFVEAGEIVAFDNDEDAMHYVNQGQAERLSEQEAQPMLDAAKAALEAKRDEMLKVRLENKTAKPKMQFGAVVPMTPAKPAPAPTAPVKAAGKARAAK
jgi:hypothetical protein